MVLQPDPSRIIIATVCCISAVIDHSSWSDNCCHQYTTRWQQQAANDTRLSGRPPVFFVRSLLSCANTCVRAQQWRQRNTARVQTSQMFATLLKMNNFEIILAEQVRRHRHLYDPNLRHHSDLHLIQKAWNEVAAATGKDEAECRKVWKNLRDKFVRIKKKVHARSSDPSPYKIMAELGWLTQFVKHRGKDPNVKVRNDVFGWKHPS